jgi:hypothetical protein
MAMSAGDLPRLICGRDPSEVWDHAVAGDLDAHEEGCPYCQKVVTDYRFLEDPVGRYLSQPVEPPPNLAERVMSRVKSELRPRSWLVLSSPVGPIRLERRAAASVLRHLLDQISGLRARSCRILPVEAPEGAGGEVAGGPTGRIPVTVSLSVAVAVGMDIPSTADSVRELVVEGAARLLGLEVGRVDVEVVDLFVEEGTKWWRR